jgi:hypothetical protein
MSSSVAQRRIVTQRCSPGGAGQVAWRYNRAFSDIAFARYQKCSLTRFGCGDDHCIAGQRPVFSVQMTDTEPITSLAGRRRTMALRRVMACMPIASVKVIPQVGHWGSLRRPRPPPRSHEHLANLAVADKIAEGEQERRC